MLQHNRLFLLIAISIGAAATFGCESASPAAPSNDESKLVGLRLVGSVVQGSNASAQSVAVSAQSVGGMTVTVKDNPSLSTTVARNGSFQLKGLPATAFTLLFAAGGSTVGKIPLSPVQGAQTINLVVQLVNGQVDIVALEGAEEEDGDNNDTDDGDDGNTDDGQVGNDDGQNGDHDGDNNNSDDGSQGDNDGQNEDSNDGDV
jgi:hypothetical protein